MGTMQMPTYVYRCPKHRNISIQHGMREQATECPAKVGGVLAGHPAKVGGRGIIRVYTPTPTILKGGGFYKTEKR